MPPGPLDRNPQLRTGILSQGSTFVNKGSHVRDAVAIFASSVHTLEFDCVRACPESAPASHTLGNKLVGVISFRQGTIHQHLDSFVVRYVCYAANAYVRNYHRYAPPRETVYSCPPGRRS